MEDCQCDEQEKPFPSPQQGPIPKNIGFAELKRGLIPKKFDDGTLPEGFLDDICLLPTFYQPETDELRWATHQNIRRTLFFSLFRDIKYCEFKRMQWAYPDGTFQLNKIEKTHDGRISSLIEQYLTKEKVRGRMIDSYLLTINRYTTDKDEENDKVRKVGRYRVKVYHLDDDEFRTKVYPMQPIDYLRYCWFTRTWFRIM